LVWVGSPSDVSDRDEGRGPKIERIEQIEKTVI